MEKLCEVCLEKKSITTCRLCGRSICSQHYTGSGLCSICSVSLCSLCRERLAITECSICSRLICEICSRQITPVVRICLQCYRRGYREWPPRDMLEKEVESFQKAVREIEHLFSSLSEKRIKSS